MPKGYMLSAHLKLADPEKAEAYRALARPALEAMGGKIIAAAYESDGYKKALDLLEGGADRDIRLFEGLE